MDPIRLTAPLSPTICTASKRTLESRFLSYEYLVHLYLLLFDYSFLSKYLSHSVRITDNHRIFSARQHHRLPFELLPLLYLPVDIPLLRLPVQRLANLISSQNSSPPYCTIDFHSSIQLHHGHFDNNPNQKARRSADFP